jgi:hypothetical protein
MEKLKEKPTQCEKILKVLEEAGGNWVKGEYFLHNLYLSQYHARIFELQRKGYNIEASEETDLLGFKQYRLVPSEPTQVKLF